MSGMTNPDPGAPEEYGIESETPDLAQIEAARLLANDARQQLNARGFSDEQIRLWAETYVAEEGGSADLPDFFNWIDSQER